MEDACMHVADNDGTNNEKESGERMGGGGKGLPHGDHTVELAAVWWSCGFGATAQWLCGIGYVPA